MSYIKLGSTHFRKGMCNGMSLKEFESKYGKYLTGSLKAEDAWKKLGGVEEKRPIKKATKKVEKDE